eukprot:9736512-Karenia_brevis.AAC.1
MRISSLKPANTTCGGFADLTALSQISLTPLSNSGACRTRSGMGKDLFAEEVGVLKQASTSV